MEYATLVFVEQLLQRSYDPNPILPPYSLSHGPGSKDKLMEIRKNRMRPTPNLIVLLKVGKSTPLLMLKSHCSTSKAYKVFDEEEISPGFRLGYKPKWKKIRNAQLLVSSDDRIRQRRMLSRCTATGSHPRRKAREEGRKTEKRTSSS
ncbi:hypothetical protein DAPPUDRAFT_238816 [Daphnia pulex]|uniref:Uncharacterized protein n=1 Tax=Daphnia pulex TaxID=6669 RepID=E9G7H1_DAPPU|nr:hypothetical protein DAPPUDRAFT_238816 [Daphnia pulex]|eukprot:EFX84462.1 hypothetical protein DAPPUDRAFT_238816 [Daphnia pulex]